MTTTVITPDSTVSSGGATVTGAASAHAALADASDGTYVSLSGSGGNLTVGYSTFTLPAGAVVTAAVNNFRASGAGALGETRVGATSGGVFINPLPGAATDYTDTGTVSTSGPVSTQADIDGYQTRYEGFFGGAIVYRASVSITYATLPSVDSTGPTGTITTTSSPAATWTHTPGSDAQTGQTKARVRVFTAAQYGVGGFNPGLSPYTQAFEVAGAASSLELGPLSNGTYRVYVWTAQTTAGVDQWSAEDYSQFTINVADVELDAVTATTSTTGGAIDVLVERTVSDPAWEYVDVEASSDGGATWTPLRESPFTPADADELLVLDHEAPANTPMLYRARAYRTVTGLVIVGPWEQSVTPAEWALEQGEGAWIKDPDRPELNTQTCLTVVPEPDYGRTVGVFRPVGATYPVVVSDVQEASTTTVELLVRSDVEELAARTLLGAPVLLLDMPPEYGWGSRYVAPVRVGVRRVGAVRPGRPNPDRLVRVELVEVARP